MKNLLMIIVILNTAIYGQVSADLTIENQQAVGTDFFFDIYLTRTAIEDVYLGTADFVLTFNSAAFTSPVVSREPVTYWNLTSTNLLDVGLIYRLATAPAVITGNELIINLSQVAFGDQQEFDDNIAKINNTPATHRIGRYRVSGISNPSGYMNLQWKATGSGVTTQVFTLAPQLPWLSSPVTINAINPPNAPLNSNPTAFQLSVSYTNGWNMASVPGQNPDGMGVNIWWAYRDPLANVFVYAGGYQAISETTPGTGYWMKHSGDRTYNTGDEWPAGGINIVPHNSINANAGWNLIGGYEYNAAVSGITTTPSGLQSSAVYGYSGGYQVVDYLIPGHGYWIKLSAPGLINLPVSLEKNYSDDIIKKDWGKIILTDALGKCFILYSIKENANLDYYELPPLPPAGMFDIRYGNGRFVEDLNSGIKSIEMNGVTYPLTVRVENTELRIQDETGKILNSLIKSGEEITISSSLTKLLVSGEIMPDKYSLEQNYPNPFNPSTKIEFSLLEDVNNAALTIYNALGQKVLELVNSKLEAGRYSYVWNAGDAATGLYIYELRTDKFVSVKKMILLH
ncbi:MAG: hypothetical protein DAHOPDDO_03323 [Ignavibacteriaceae bacterium]|nr:hypothetical protein [Ignavibacteriaceae bacterium]NUM62335.1 T9SS type A sorting domain-containing protein [Ignavibacteriaceae bacterium]